MIIDETEQQIETKKQETCAHGVDWILPNFGHANWFYIWNGIVSETNKNILNWILEHVTTLSLH